MTVTLSQKDADFVLGVLRHFAELDETAIAGVERTNETLLSALRRSIDGDDTLSADRKDSVRFIAEAIFSAVNSRRNSYLIEMRGKLMRCIELLTAGSGGGL